MAANGVVEDVFSLYIGGKVGDGQTHLGKNYGELLARQVPAFLYELALDLKNEGLEFNEYLLYHKHNFQSILGKYLV